MVHQVAPGGGLVCGQADGGDTSPRALARKASDLAASAASRASGIFNCAADTVHVEKDGDGDDFFEDAIVGTCPDPPVTLDGNNDEGDDFFENGRVSPTGNDYTNNDEWEGEKSEVPEAVGGTTSANKLTAVVDAVDGGSAKTPANDEEAVHRTTASPLDELQVKNLPNPRAAVITVDSGNDDADNVEKVEGDAPSPNKKRRLVIVLGLIVLLVAIAVAVGVALQQTSGNDASSLEQNEVQSDTLGTPTARPSPTDAPINGPEIVSTLTIELQTDEYGEETSWSLYSIDVATGMPIALVASVGEDTYEPFEQDSKEVKLAPGKYRFILKDKYGDGFCCNNGREGWYTVSLDGRELIRGAYYMRQVRYDIIVGYDWSATMSERDGEWLEAHNSRRKTWHERYGETYIPLMWSQELANDAQSWANDLLNDCEIPGISHESDVEEGENLAKNKATAPGGMGKLYPP
ncbi:hypothetical protein ACHAXT_002443 [Thalassiosira profunda]